jgi:hypothetical protein
VCCSNEEVSTEYSESSKKDSKRHPIHRGKPPQSKGKKRKAKKAKSDDSSSSSGDNDNDPDEATIDYLEDIYLKSGDISKC